MEGIYTFVNFDISVGPMPDPDAEHRRLIIFKINYENSFYSFKFNFDTINLC